MKFLEFIIVLLAMVSLTILSYNVGRMEGEASGWYKTGIEEITINARGLSFRSVLKTCAHEAGHLLYDRFPAIASDMTNEEFAVFVEDSVVWKWHCSGVVCNNSKVVT